jgi:bifunctional non-homologous end joining protein LigD
MALRSTKKKAPSRALRVYKAKRDFRKTPEPGPKVASSHTGDSFVIQKHDATRLHYDFRLELDGVLLSWAVPNGPSLDPTDKRLAVRTEDHPLAYGGFEGVIPETEYGGGTVMLWDKGRWKPEEDPHKGLKKGHLKFQLMGERMKGRWHLARLKRNEGKKENWLLIKGHDDESKPGEGKDLVEHGMTSVTTGRPMEEIAAERDRVWSSKVGEIKAEKAAGPKAIKLKGAKSGDLPAFVPPALASLTDKPPSGDRWLHEIKFDGYRMQLRLEKGRAKLLTRSGLDWTQKFQAIAKAAIDLPVKAGLFDGEVVSLDASGVSSFSALQEAIAEGKTSRLVFYLFDLLHLDGKDVSRLPLEERKAALAALLADTDQSTIRFSDHYLGSGSDFFGNACRLALEGMISKRRDLPYRSGRNGDWLKIKCGNEQEFVVGGWMPSQAKGHELRSLLLGYYQGKTLNFAGKVGTGWGLKAGADMAKKLRALERKASPFKDVPREAARGAKWVEPQLVVEVEYAGWTADKVLRHASLKGIREDKNAEEVVLEEDGAQNRKQSVLPKAGVPKDKYAGITLTNPDRVLWPEDGVTKQDLADYYAEVLPLMLPHVVRRPLSLLRCPDGTSGQCFFQRHMGQGLPKQVHPAKVRSEKEPYLAIEDAAGLFALVQFSAMELHPWGSLVDDPERPDRVVMDFDPGPNVQWRRVVEAAKECRQRLKELGLESFCKTTGGKGLHVVFPLERRHSWPEVRAFAEALAGAMAADDSIYVTTMAKKQRNGRIFVDFLRNDRTATAIAPYSSRARPGATVAVPLEWGELKSLPSGRHYTVMNLERRLRPGFADPWAELPNIRQLISAKARRAVGLK